MYLLFETSAGFAIFKVLDKNLLKDVSAAETAFSTPELAKKRWIYYVKRETNRIW